MSIGLNANNDGSGSIQVGGSDAITITSGLAVAIPQTLTVTGTSSLNGNLTVTGTGSVSGNLSFNSGYGSSAVAYGCRAWVNFNGTGTPAIRASGNVSSITDNGLGDYTVNFTTAMTDSNYSVISSSEGGGSVGNPPYQRGNYPITSTASIRLTFFNQSASVFVDPTYVCAAVFR